MIGRQGNTFTLVHKTATRDSYRAMLSEQWNKGVFDEETATLIWFKGYLVNRNQMKYQFALEKLKEPSPKQEYLDYVKSFSMQKAHEFIKMHKEDELIALIQRIHPFLETHVLQDLLCKATDENLATSSAYLLECLKTRDHKPNRSLEL